jgi:hypothetical protein
MVDRRSRVRRRVWSALLAVIVVAGFGVLAGFARTSATGAPGSTLWVQAPPVQGGGGQSAQVAPQPAEPTVAVPTPAPTPAPTVTNGRGARAGVAIPGTRLLYSGSSAGAAAVERVAALGVRWLRFDAAWSEIEVSPGTYQWGDVDRVLAAARARGLSVVLILGSSATWARPAGAEWNYGPNTDDQRAGFASFAAAAARRYQGQAAAFEIWNEPNLPGSWAPSPDPDAYLRLLTAAYQAIHAADPGARVLTGGTGGGLTGIDTITWYQRLYAAGLHSVCDGVAIHPYPDAPVADSGEMGKAKRIRTIMDGAGDTAKLLWGTETGAPTGGQPSVDEPHQSTLVGQLYDLWSAVPRTGPLLYYTLTDFGGADREGHFGLLRADGTAKPAYDALRAWTTRN